MYRCSLQHNIFIYFLLCIFDWVYRRQFVFAFELALENLPVKSIEVWLLSIYLQAHIRFSQQGAYSPRKFWNSFWPRFSRRRPICNHPLSLHQWSVFKYHRDRPLVFVIFCMKLGHHKGTKVTEPDFEKKSWGVTNGWKTPIWGYFWRFFVHISTFSH